MHLRVILLRVTVTKVANPVSASFICKIEDTGIKFRHNIVLSAKPSDTHSLAFTSHHLLCSKLITIDLIMS